MLVLAVKKFYLIVSDSPTIPHILCAEFMQMNVQGFVGMHRRSMTVVYSQIVKKLLKEDKVLTLDLKSLMMRAVVRIATDLLTSTIIRTVGRVDATF